MTFWGLLSSLPAKRPDVFCVFAEYIHCVCKGAGRWSGGDVRKSGSAHWNIRALVPPAPVQPVRGCFSSSPLPRPAPSGKPQISLCVQAAIIPLPRDQRASLALRESRLAWWPYCQQGGILTDHPLEEGKGYLVTQALHRENEQAGVLPR